AEANASGRLLMKQPGVGPNTGMAFVLTIGDVSRFSRGKQVANYLGLIRREETSGRRQKLGAITKQGNRLMRSLLVEAAQIAVHNSGDYDEDERQNFNCMRCLSELFTILVAEPSFHAPIDC